MRKSKKILPYSGFAAVAADTLYGGITKTTY